jgi:uncharacterized repeat protein (TIGR03803 family)
MSKRVLDQKMTMSPTENAKVAKSFILTMISWRCAMLNDLWPPSRARSALIVRHRENEMNSMRFSLLLGVALAIMFSLSTRVQAQTVTTFANFNDSDGNEPFAGSLIQATDGNYYGTAFYGGTHVEGTVFQVTPSGSISAIYNFCSLPLCNDGFSPQSGVILGVDGNLYGTTYYGGPHGGGTVFKVTPAGKLTTLYRFCLTKTCPDGKEPNGLVQASNGNFYGTTANLGANASGGTIFEISSAGKFKTLYNFCSKDQCTDGASPFSGLIQGSDGNLYGTTYSGGAYNSGTVFEISPGGKFSTLYSFCAQTNCPDGSAPIGLMQAADGSFYGTTWQGGAYEYGSAFQFTTAHQLITLHSFDNTDDGASPWVPIQANDGNFYGTTDSGSVNNAGTIYEISSSGVFSSLYNFCSSLLSCFGQYPSALSQVPNGILYGTASGGSGDGLIFGLSNGFAPLVQTVPVAAKVGKRVMILGNGLTDATSVTFNGAPAAFTVVSSTEITATVPKGATTGTVSVSTPTETLNSNPVFQVLQ